MRLHRMISILLLIESKGKVKAKELALELETSVRTIYRDIDALCEAGIPLTADSGPNGGIHFMEGYDVGIKNLQGEDIINLYLNGIGIKADRQSDMGMKLNNVLLKLEKNVPRELCDDINTIKRRFYVDDTPWWGDMHRLQNIDMLIQSVCRSRKLRIAYKKHKGELSFRNIRPYGIVVKEMNWYMIAYCEKSNDIRMFKCDRIIKCEYLDENFIIPEDFFIDEFWKRSSDAFINQCSQSEKYPVVIRIAKNRADILKSFDIYKIEEKENYIDATINMFKYEFAVNDLIRIIGYVEVISPEELRSYVKGELCNIIRKYNSSI